jgi:hypothetical protein
MSKRRSGLSFQQKPYCFCPIKSPSLPLPLPPTNLSADVIQPTSVSISFLKGETFGLPILNYLFSFNNGAFFPFSPAQTESPVTFTDLTPSTTYHIRLQSITSAGTSVTSTAVSFTTQNVGIQPIIHLDASTYSGTGDWVDLISGRSFTLYNNPTHSAVDGGGSFTFSNDSTNNPLSQYAMAQTAVAPALFTWTVEVWHYYTGFWLGRYGNGSAPCIVAGRTDFGNNCVLGNFDVGSQAVVPLGLETGFWNGSHKITTPLIQPTINTWIHLVGQYDQNNVTIYLNGVQMVQTTVGEQTLYPNTIFHLMRRWDDAEYVDGKLAVVKIYDETISFSQIVSNYNSQKARFGIS